MNRLSEDCDTGSMSPDTRVVVTRDTPADDVLAFRPRLISSRRVSLCLLECIGALLQTGVPKRAEYSLTETTALT